jgi:hypothetical protein
MMMYCYDSKNIRPIMSCILNINARAKVAVNQQIHGIEAGL